MTPTRLLWSYFSSQRLRLVGSVVLAALTSISTISLLGISAWLIARSAQIPAIMELNVAIVGVRTFALLRSVTRYSERLLSHDATFRSLTEIRMALYEKLEAITPLRLSQYSRGDLVSRVVTDVDEVQNLPLRVVIPVASSAIASLFTVALMTWLLPLAGILLGVFLVVASTIVPWLTTRNVLANEVRVAHNRGHLSEQLIEHFAGLTDIVMLGETENSLNKIHESNNNLLKTERASAFTLGSANALLVFLQSLALVATVATAIDATQHSSLSPVMMIVISLLPLAAFESVLGLPAAITSLARVRGSAQRLQAVLEIDAQPESQIQNPISTLDLHVDDVSLRWPTTEHVVISGLTFAAPEKSSIGIVGPSGSGKSTIVNMLIKFLKVDSGRYSIDAIDVNQIPGHHVREHIVATGHDAHIFATTIRENLKLAARDEVSDDELWTVLQKVNLASWVQSLPDQLDAIVGENGSTMSGGQRQRLLMARMFVNKPAVWVLDEPTEHLDSHLATSLMANIATETQDSTLIVVSHRPSDIETSDTVIRL